MVEWKPLPTIWDVPDDLRERIGPVILELDPPKSKGRNRVDQRKMLEGIIFRLRSGCQWNHLPKELGDDSTIHRTFQRWVERGVLEAIWAVLIEECQELGGGNWEWQSADCSLADITRMPCPWRQCISLFTEELPWLSESDKELIMGRAVCEWLGWKLPA